MSEDEDASSGDAVRLTYVDGEGKIRALRGVRVETEGGWVTLYRRDGSRFKIVASRIVEIRESVTTEEGEP